MMFQLWVYQEEVLMRLSKHYLDGHSLPQAITAKIVRHQHFQERHALARLALCYSSSLLVAVWWCSVVDIVVVVVVAIIIIIIMFSIIIIIIMKKLLLLLLLL
jgi:RsiW-degrading membrane proteinase PrsW (M82 family)